MLRDILLVRTSIQRWFPRKPDSTDNTICAYSKNSVLTAFVVSFVCVFVVTFLIIASIVVAFTTFYSIIVTFGTSIVAFGTSIVAFGIITFC